MKLKEALLRKKFIVTSEVHASVGEDPQEIIKNLDLVHGRVTGVTVAEVDLEGIVGNRVETCELLRRNRFEPIYQTTTREKNRLQLQKDLVRAHEAGVDNLLVFTEDYRLTGDSLQEMMFFHVDSGKLASVIDHLREGQAIDGREFISKAEFTMGSGVESGWGKNVPELEMKEMEEMTKIGTGYFLTTPVFDLNLFEKFMKQVRTFSVPVISEVMILRTAGMAQFLNRHFKSGLVPDWIVKKLANSPDKVKASVEVFAEIVRGLRDLCQGIHIITIGGEERLKYYLDEAKLG